MFVGALVEGGELILATAARQAVVSLGTSIASISWASQLQGLVGAVTVITVAGLSSDNSPIKYEVPALPGEPVLKPTRPPVSSGLNGSYNNPYPYNAPSVRYSVVGNFKVVWDSLSNDGFNHYLEKRTYTADELLAAVNSIVAKYASEPVASAIYVDASQYTGRAFNDDWPASWVNRVNSNGEEVYYQGFSIIGYGGFNRLQVGVLPNTTVIKPIYVEAPDGVKRFLRTTTGFAPDPADPDWTQEELNKYASSGATLQFKNSTGIVNISTTDGNDTLVRSATQNGAGVKYREASLNQAASPTRVAEQNYASATAGDVMATIPGSGSETGGETIEFPNDYARNGEAKAAAESINIELELLRKDIAVTGDPPSDPTEPDADGFKKSFFDGTFDKLRAWTVPGHSSVCPTADLSFEFYGHQFGGVMSAQCDILLRDDIAEIASSCFVVVWLLIALFTVLEA